MLNYTTYFPFDGEHLCYELILLITNKYFHGEILFVSCYLIEIFLDHIFSISDDIVCIYRILLTIFQRTLYP